MLDSDLLHHDIEPIIKQMQKRGGDFSYLRKLALIEKKRLKLNQEYETLKKMRTTLDHKIGYRKTSGKSMAHIAQRDMQVKQQLETFEKQIQLFDKAVQKGLALTPNLPHHECPNGNTVHDHHLIERYKTTNVSMHVELKELFDYLDQHTFKRIDCFSHLIDERHHHSSLEKKYLPIKEYAVDDNSHLKACVLFDTDLTMSFIDAVLDFLRTRSISFEIIEVCAGLLDKAMQKSFQIALLMPNGSTLPFVTISYAGSYLTRRYGVHINTPATAKTVYPHSLHIRMDLTAFTQ